MPALPIVQERLQPTGFKGPEHMRFKYVLFVLLLAVFALLTGSQAVRGCFAAGSPQAGGQAAPDFTVTSFADGSSVSLSDLRGKVVLLYFWFPT
jgi:cytochrome oxidase Cu insertion factor (SCO1/SenC/PrrC family)